MIFGNSILYLLPIAVLFSGSREWGMEMRLAWGIGVWGLPFYRVITFVVCTLSSNPKPKCLRAVPILNLIVLSKEGRNGSL